MRCLQKRWTLQAQRRPTTDRSDFRRSPQPFPADQVGPVAGRQGKRSAMVGPSVRRDDRQDRHFGQAGVIATDRQGLFRCQWFVGCVRVVLGVRLVMVARAGRFGDIDLRLAQHSVRHRHGSHRRGRDHDPRKDQKQREKASHHHDGSNAPTPDPWQDRPSGDAFRPGSPWRMFSSERAVARNIISGGKHSSPQRSTRRSRSALLMTETEDRLIAAAASLGSCFNRMAADPVPYRRPCECGKWRESAPGLLVHAITAQPGHLPHGQVQRRTFHQIGHSCHVQHLRSANPHSARRICQRQRMPISPLEAHSRVGDHENRRRAPNHFGD